MVGYNTNIYGERGKNYEIYLASKTWANKRKEFLSQQPYCSICNSSIRLHIHHKHYNTLGEEKITDILILCSRCHYNIHYNKKGNKRNLGHVEHAYQKLYGKIHKRRKHPFKTKKEWESFNRLHNEVEALEAEFNEIVRR